MYGRSIDWVRSSQVARLLQGACGQTAAYVQAVPPDSPSHDLFLLLIMSLRLWDTACSDQVGTRCARVGVPNARRRVVPP